MISKSNGIFITAQIIIYILASTEGTWSVEDIETLPQDIKSLYSIAYERSSAKLQPFELLLRRHCLRWLAIGIQPIRVEEALNALNVESNALPSNFNDQVMRACGPLITIENDVLKPVHPTLKEYLLGPGIGTMLGSAERIQVTHSEVAKTCLRYLLHQAFGANSMDTTDLHALRATYPLLQYSSMYWIQHVTLADPSDSELFELVKALFLTRNGFLWADVLLPAFMPTSVLPLPPRATHNARIFHLFMLKNQLVRFFKSAHPEIDDHLSNFLRNSYEEALATAREDPTKGLKVMKRLMDLSVLYSWLPDQRPKASQLIHEAYHVLIYESSAPREIAIQLLQALGDDHKINGRYEKAGTAYLQLLDTYQSSPPDTDPQLIFVYDALGWVQMRLGQLDKAEKSLRSALEMAVEFYGARSPFTLRSKVTLAEVLSKLGQAEEAESLCTQLTEQLEQHHLNGVPLPKDSISQLNTLALIYKARGDHLRTKEAFAVVVEDRRKIFGGEHPMTLWATAQMALAQRAAGELDAAREVFAILLPLQEKILGSEHPDVKESKNQLEEIGPHDG
jgi:tetratricopeptide (TPR) repeat protein